MSACVYLVCQFACGSYSTDMFSSPRLCKESIVIIHHNPVHGVMKTAQGINVHWTHYYGNLMIVLSKTAVILLDCASTVKSPFPFPPVFNCSISYWWPVALCLRSDLRDTGLSLSPGRSVMAEPDFLEGDCDQLIKPKKLINPVKNSRNHQDLHRELLMNQKRLVNASRVEALSLTARFTESSFIDSL